MLSQGLTKLPWSGLELGIYLPQPPEWLELKACVTTPDLSENVQGGKERLQELPSGDLSPASTRPALLRCPKCPRLELVTESGQGVGQTASRV